MAQRKVQLYLTEEQYRILKQRAGEHGSIAAAVRDLIDGSVRPADYKTDPFYRYLMRPKQGSGSDEPAQETKRRIYREQR